MHHFLRNTRALYFTQKQDEVLPSDQEFVLSEDFKTSLVSAIQQQLFTWRMTPHAWAVDKDLFENLVSLIFCSTVYLIMTDEVRSAHIPRERTLFHPPPIKHLSPLSLRLFLSIIWVCVHVLCVK